MPPNTVAEDRSDILSLHVSCTLPKGKGERPVRRVRFANQTKVYLISALSEMSDEEFYATWTTDEDSHEARAEIVKTIKAMRSGSTDHANVCMRGLEHMRSAAHLEQSRHNKDAVLRAVLEEQERQWSAGQENHEAIANVAAQSSEWARDSALALGESDAASARRIHAENTQLAEMFQSAIDVSTSPDNGSLPFTHRQGVSTTVLRTHVNTTRSKAPRAKSVDSALDLMSSRRHATPSKHPQGQHGEKTLKAELN